VGEKVEFLRKETFCELWLKELCVAKDLYKFQLYAFCLNYEHFHLMIKPDNEIANYSDIMRFLKRHFTRNANIILGYDKYSEGDITLEGDVGEGDVGESDVGESDVGESDVGESDVGESDVGQRRLRNRDREPWQIEMDEFVLALRERFIHEYGENHKIPKFKWQASFYDHVIRDQRDYDYHWNYTMHNFRKHGLLDDWKYTGLIHPELIDVL